MRSGMHGPGMLPSPQEMDQGKCAERVRRLVGALAMYAMDYDDRLPPADRWCDGTFRYVQSEEFFHCPTQPNRYGYAYRRDLDGARPSEVALPAQAVILFDSSTSARNAVGSRDDVCRPPRHPSGNTFGYLDGHAATVPAAGR